MNRYFLSFEHKIFYIYIRSMIYFAHLNLWKIFFSIFNFSIIQIIANYSSIVCNSIFHKTNDLCAQYECHNNKHSFPLSLIIRTCSEYTGKYPRKNSITQLRLIYYGIHFAFGVQYANSLCTIFSNIFFQCGN